MTRPPPRDSNRSSKVGRHSEQGLLEGDPRLDEFMQLLTPTDKHTPAEGLGRRFARGGTDVRPVPWPHGQHADQGEGPDGLPQGTASDPETFH